MKGKANVHKSGLWEQVFEFEFSYKWYLHIVLILDTHKYAMWILQSLQLYAPTAKDTDDLQSCLKFVVWQKHQLESSQKGV